MHLDFARSKAMHPEPPAPNRRRTQMRWFAASLTVVALLVAACSGTPDSGSSGGPAAQATTTTAVALQPLEQPGSRCGAPDTKATLVRFQAADGTSLDGVMVGRGVTRVALVGVSMGGAAVLIAGTRVQPPVAAVVSLSGETDPTSLVGGIPLHAGAAVKQLAVPTMLVVATNDRYVSVEETRAMYRAVKTGDKRLEVLSGDFDGGHGWALLKNPATGEEFGPVAAKVAAFLTAHTHG